MRRGEICIAVNVCVLVSKYWLSFPEEYTFGIPIKQFHFFIDHITMRRGEIFIAISSWNNNLQAYGMWI